MKKKKLRFTVILCQLCWNLLKEFWNTFLLKRFNHFLFFFLCDHLDFLTFLRISYHYRILVKEKQRKEKMKQNKKVNKEEPKP